MEVTSGTKDLTLGLLQKFQAQRYFNVSKYMDTLQRRKFFEEFNQIKDVWKDCS